MSDLPLTAFLSVIALLQVPTMMWPYLVGAILLTAGLVIILTTELPHAHGWERVLIFGRLFFAVPLGVFGADHFIAAAQIADMVPSWIPGHLFWAYFVGVALIAAATSILVRRQSALAATLLGIMIFSFVVLIHIPNLVAEPGDRFALAVLLRDTSFSAGAFALALGESGRSLRSSSRRIIVVLRFLIGVPVVVFGFEHFFHPQFVPVVPLKQPMPDWIPGHLLLAYVTGAVLIAAGFCIITGWKARTAASWLGVVVFAIIVLVYLPLLIAKPSDIANGLNYLADTLMFAGVVLLLAAILPGEQPAYLRAADPSPATL